MKRLASILGLCMWPVACGGPVGGEEQPQVEEHALQDGELLIDGTVVADVTLAGGTEVTFIEAEGGVGIYERIPAGAPGLQEFANLEGAELVDIFLAVTEPGTPVPAAIERISAPSKAIGAQGWVRDAATAGNYTVPRSVCTNSTFSNAVTSYGYNDRGTPSLRLDQLVAVDAPFFESYTDCFGTSFPGGCPQFYRYTVGGNDGSVWSNIDRYYTRVAVCNLGTHPTITSNYGSSWYHPGPVLDVSYRNTSNSSWSYVIHEDFAPNDVGTARAWHYYGTGGPNWDWRTQIDLAKPWDNFDIGHAVEDL